MALAYIKRRVASEMGLGNYNTDPEQNLQLLDKINIACEAIWEETDLPGCLRELLVNVQADSSISFPGYLGEIRAVREKSLMHKWTIHDMRPRYQQEPWPQLWRNWRHLGKRATMLPITVGGPLKYDINTADGSSITVTGRTQTAHRTSETITFNTTGPTSINGQVSFIGDIYSIVKTTGVNSQDITISDQDGNILAILYNDDVETAFICLDVSQYPFGGETVAGERVMEVLYKMKLPLLVNDADTFPVPGWDNIIVDRTLQAYAEPQEGKEQRALLLASKVEKQSHQKIKSQEGGIEKEMQFAENPMYDITKRPYSRIWRG